MNDKFNSQFFHNLCGSLKMVQKMNFKSNIDSLILLDISSLLSLVFYVDTTVELIKDSINIIDVLKRRQYVDPTTSL
jgi:hypothetical protein